MNFKREIVVYTLVSLLSIGFGIVITTAFTKKHYNSVNYEDVDDNKEIVKNDKHGTKIQKSNLENQINDIQEQMSALKEMSAKLNSENRVNTNNGEDSGTLLVNVNIVNNDEKTGKKEIVSDKKSSNKKEQQRKRSNNKITKKRPATKKKVKQNANVVKPMVEEKKVDEKENNNIVNETKEIKTIETIVHNVEHPQRVNHTQDVENQAEDQKRINEANQEDDNVVYNTIIVEDDEDV